MRRSRINETKFALREAKSLRAQALEAKRLRVVALVKEGLTTTEIARRLLVSTQTVAKVRREVEG